MNLRDTIFAAKEAGLELKPEPVPEWGCDVFLRGWTGKERDDFERDFGDLEKSLPPNLRARVLVRFLFNQDGSRIFTDADAGELGGKFIGPIARLYRKVMELASKGDTGDPAKNGESGLSAAFTVDSPVNSDT